MRNDEYGRETSTTERRDKEHGVAEREREESPLKNPRDMCSHQAACSVFSSAE